MTQNGKENEDQYFKKIYMFGQIEKDLTIIYLLKENVMPETTIDNSKMFLTELFENLEDNYLSQKMKFNKKFGNIKSKNNLLYFFFNKLNSFISFKQNFSRTNLFSNKLKVKT